VALNLLLLIVGLLLAGFTLRDVFETVIVPGGSRASLKVAKRLVWTLLPLWRVIGGRRRGVSSAFGPLILVLCFVVWMALLAIGFGLVAFAVREDFHPVLTSLADAIYIVGSSLVTVGLAQSNPFGAARWVVLGAGFCGLAVMTMAVTYLLEVQNSVSRRDIGIIKLNTSAGEPPSAVTLLQRFAAIGNRAELPALLREGRDWCATVRQSHANHPSLIYFQSVSTGSGWPAGLGALIDLALIAEEILDEPELVGAAVLLREEAERMGRELAAIIHLSPVEVKPNELELRQAIEQLDGAGYPLREGVDVPQIARKRALLQHCMTALAAHLGKAPTMLVRQA